MAKRTNVSRAGNCGEFIKTVIARHYLRLMDKYCSDKSGRMYLSMTATDMFHNAVTLILQDSSMQNYTTEKDALQRIEQRIRNVFSEIKQDHKQEKSVEYADDIQTKTSTIE